MPYAISSTTISRMSIVKMAINTCPGAEGFLVAKDHAIIIAFLIPGQDVQLGIGSTGGEMAKLRHTPSHRDLVDHSIDNLFLEIIVFGASGDLAKKKTFPALFALYERGCV